MEDNLSIIERLDRIEGQNSWREDQLEKMGIYHPVREELVRKGLLDLDKTNPYPSWEYRISGKAYDLMNSRKNYKEETTLSKENLFWQKWGVIITVLSLVVAILALAVTILPYLVKQ